MGPNGQIIIDVIPEVELIIGKQPAVPQLGPTESQNRFNWVFQKFIGVFAKPEHPLVIFLDDLQWADSASLKLFQALMANPDIRYLFVIGAYRDHEVGPDHPLTLALAEIQKSGAAMSHISLSPLGMNHLRQLIAETLKCKEDGAIALAELVMRKTHGNPFFVTQFLTSLHQEHLLRFDYSSGQWQFDLGQIERREMTDNVVELMAGKIQKLSKPAQQILKLAACIGNRFDLHTLSIVNEKSLSRTADDLWEAIQEGLVLPIGNVYELFDFAQDRLSYGEGQEITHDLTLSYKFLHDRVQQAAYGLIPESRRKEVHLKVGQLMLANSSPTEREEKLFDIVNHLNLGIELLADPKVHPERSQRDRSQLAHLNLAAGKKAKASTAYKTALSYFHIGRTLLSGESWALEYDFTFDLYTELAECEFLCGHFDEAERYFDFILEKARTRLDKARIYDLKIHQYENLTRYADAIRVGHEALALFGVSFPDSLEEKQAALDTELLNIQALVGDRTIDALIDLPVMEDPESRRIIKLLSNLHTSCYLVGDKILTLLNTSKMVHLSLTRGNAPESAHAYVLHAMHLGPIRGDYKSAYEFGLLAMRLNERLPHPGLRAKILMNFSWAVSIWRKPIMDSFVYTQETFRLANESGFFSDGAFALFNETYFTLLAGRELSALPPVCEVNVSYLKRIKMDGFVDAPRVIRQWGLALQGLTESPTSLTGAGFDEAMYRQVHREHSLFEMFYFIVKLALLDTFEEYQAACRVAEEAERVIRDYTGTIWDELRVFYHALALAALYSKATAEERWEAEALLDTLNARLAWWAESCPHNFQAQHLMVSAEIARVQGRDVEAIAFYGAAIDAAANQECPRERALANELCARFWLDRGQGKVAAVFMAEAWHSYTQWGATAKVKDLERKYPDLLGRPASRSFLETMAAPPAAQVTAYTKASALDVATVVKAAQAISGEIILENLLQTLMKGVIENAGAQKGLLLGEKESGEFVQAEGSVDDFQVKIFPSISGEPGQRFSPAVVNYVKRTRESLVIADAENDRRFTNDPYVALHKPKSILCVPILRQGKLIGVLYLENNLITEAFTPDRIEVVQILASQAAISLENARLYDEMKQEVTQRKRAEQALREALTEVEQLKNRLQAENVYLQEEIKTEHNFEEIVGASPAIKKVFQNIEKVARTDTTVLITGETGTGKELVARAIHNLSRRKNSALIKVNCAALPVGLIESELFGHEKGAFTGATTRKKGRFELADGGTIFLDEVGELPLETQAKLLRILQEQEFERVGGSHTLKVDVRIIAATNQELKEAIQRGSFRTDLFYRLNIFPIHLPALRERHEDIPLLTNYFVGKFSRRMGKKIDRVSRDALERLVRYRWPGNVRELANVLERAVILCDEGSLQRDHLGISEPLLTSEAEVSTLEEAERLHILRALEKTRWIIGGPSGAAKLLGLNRTTLLARMKKLGIGKTRSE